VTQPSSPEPHDKQDEVFDRFGCAILFLAAVLFGVQRFILFSWLLHQWSVGRAFAPSVTEFLFGNPPYTLTDILLGLEFPDEGLIHLLQPHNLTIAVTQAVHYGIAIGLVYMPFLLFIRARTSPRHRVWLRAGACLSALAIPVSIAVLTAALVVRPPPPDGVASPATATTSTPALAAAHTATNTPIPSPTPSPVTVDFWDMLLSLDDLPEGFEQMSVSDSDILDQDLGGDRWATRSAFMFFEPIAYQFVIGLTQFLPERMDEIQFDAAANRPEFMLELVIESLGLSGIQEQDVLSGMDGIGDTSTGVTIAYEGTGGGFPLRLDVVAFRRGSVGAYVMVTYVLGEEPVIGCGQVARLFDERITDVLLASGQPQGAVRETDSDAYVGYTNAELGFAAEYPAGWETDVTDNRNPLTGEPLEGKIAGFLPPEGDRVKRRAISVLVLTTPEGVELGPQDMPTDQEYIDYITDWAQMMPIEVVGDPVMVQVDGYKGVEVITTGSGEYDMQGIVGYQTFLVTEDRAFYIEASGDADSEPEIIRIYEHFVATFDVLPLP
jgi:hypothetical protein